MKHLMNIKSGELSKHTDQEASRLVNGGTHAYISKSEFKNKPEYLSDGMTRWYTVKSSNINSIRYSPNTKTLFIKFGQPRVTSMYKYTNVPEELFQGFLEADSKGKYFWKFIRNNPSIYKYEREY